MLDIILIGPPASGKDTQAALLNKKLNIPYIAAGDMLRKHIAGGGKWGKILAKYVHKGKLAPHRITNKIISDRLKQDDVKNGFILDGYPRDISQLKSLEKIKKIKIVFELHISNRESIKRIGGRRNCACGAVYHLKFQPPKRRGRCDKCGRKLYIREDDKEERIKERLKIYHSRTALLISYYKKKGILAKINGEQPIKDVHKDIMKALKEKGYKKFF